MTALQQLCENLKDKEYKNVWIANLNMCQYDARNAFLEKHNKKLKDLTIEDVRYIENDSSERFLKLLMAVTPDILQYESVIPLVEKKHTNGMGYGKNQKT